MEAERAFALASRARRRAALIGRLRPRRRGCSGLPVYEGSDLRRAGAGARPGVRDIPLDAIRGTLEPNRASQFDTEFRPAERTRARWQHVWLAEQSGRTLAPISVVQIGDEYAIRDGHHRVSVARARGACTIRALIDPLGAP